MNRNINVPLNSRSDVLRILQFLPHSKILTKLTLINTFFNRTIKDFPIFHNYTLKFDCGRRGSFLGKASKGFVDNKGNLKTCKNPEVVINDKQRMILITTSNKPLRSQQTKDALIQIAHTHINKIYFRSYRIPQPIMSGLSLSAPSSATSSPYQADSIATFQHNNNNKLPSIKEANMNVMLSTNRLSAAVANYNYNYNNNNNHASAPGPGPPPSASSGSGRHILNTSQSSLVAPSPTANGTNRQSYSTSSTVSTLSTISTTINSDVVDLSFPSSSQRSTVRMSESYNERDDAFEALLDILKTAPIDTLCIGEECVSWQWNNIMMCLLYFNHVKHLAVHIGMDKDSMPYIKSEQKWLDFIGEHYMNVSQLDSLWCNDDAFLRCITSLSLYRNLGKQLVFVEQPTYEKGSLKNRLAAIATATTTDRNNMMDEHDDDMMNGHYQKKRDRDSKDVTVSALAFIRYRCWDAPENELTGIEFEGASVLEVTPYDCMFITIPQSVFSFRISIGGSFYEEPDEYKIVVPYTNHVKELCLYNISNLAKIEGLYHLKSLEYVVVKRKPKDRDFFMKYVKDLCRYSPVKQITLMFNHPKYKKNNKIHDYWLQLHSIAIKDHNVIVVRNNYKVPEDVPQIHRSQFSDYKRK